ncbi:MULTISPECIES: carbonic anhydrase [Marinobacter]|uniref:Carbonic anhydrase n=1 Tax=Marinobacter suaedae TaxID=3057675 RepID=A0ABT8VX69_9GAMM|nr:MULTISPECIES: carbonic anhydrase [unclassified Marinobacter]MBZ2168711.1 carbonic anhydrase [Marinobacter sp. F4216]MDO3720589.1 carbonic anhydrase [Marinobacter sp. chi1]
MQHIVRGVLDFRQNVYPKRKDLFGALADGQNPDVLFITCSDSRIDPNLVTGTNPGDLFICRNAGNIIPPHSNETGGMTASIEYAVAVLQVRHIIICGHTDCGAVKGAMNISALKGLPHVKEWLGHCRSAMEIVRERNNVPTEFSLDSQYLNEAIEENVLQQVQHLRTHPVVAVKLAMQKVQIHGWVYNIKTGDIRCCGRDSMDFKSFDEFYAEEIARLSLES